MRSLTRGPLSPSVYWRRRVLVLGLALALVVGIAGVLRGASDGSSGADDEPVAEQVADTSSSPPGESSRRARRPKQAAASATAAATQTTPPSPTAPPLAEPTGPCSEDDILVEPVVERAVAGEPVTVVLELRTRVSEACTWTVSSGHLALKVTSGSDDIWSSHQCPRAIPADEVVVRQDVTSRLAVVWNGRRSDDGCTPRTDWALPGYYHVAAAPLGGEPAEVQFRLAAPLPEVVTASPDPRPKGERDKRRNNPEVNPGRED